MYTKIRYRARLRQPADVHLLTNEIADICQSNGWEYHCWDEDWSKPNTISLTLEDGATHANGHAPLKGITFQTGPEEESTWLTFSPDGLLNSLFSLQDPTFTANDAHYSWQRVKVQLGDTQNFAAICHLFRYVSEKYCADFQVVEETGYWTHRNLNKLEAFMSKTANASRQLDNELAVLYEDESIDLEKKREMMMALMKQFGEAHRPYDPSKEED